MSDDPRSLALAWRDHRDEGAARALMEALWPRVAGLCRKHMPAGAAEEDLAQETFRKVFSRIDQWDATHSVEPWVLQIALNTCRDALRARRRRPELRWSDLSEAQQHAYDSAAAAEAPTAALAGDGREVLVRLLDTLGAEDRLIISLLHLEEKSLAEISELTGWNRTLIKVRAFRARQKLKAALKRLESARGPRELPP